MNHEQFCYWLSGILSRETITPELQKKIKKALKRVIYSPIINVSNSTGEPFSSPVDPEDDFEDDIIGFKQQKNESI
jgi:hypothetical protein